MANSTGTCIFIDENLEAKQVGIYSVVWPPSVQQVVYRIREKHKLYDEIKWTTTSKLKLPVYLELITGFFNNPNWGRVSLVPVTSSVDGAILFGLRRIQRYCEPINGIFIDNHTTPRGYEFERELSQEFNCRCVMRLDSKTNDLLQLCDLLMNLRIKSLAPEAVASITKKALLDHFMTLATSQAQGRFFDVK